MKKQIRFVMMVGLPASGKSTVAKEMSEQAGMALLSSDEIRKEIFNDESNQDNNSMVFEIMNNRLKENIKKGISCIYDATNINSKRRKAILSQVPKDVRKTCIYVGVNYRECIKRDLQRERVVGAEVIEKMYKSMQIPMYHEGWDDIILYPLHFMYNNTKELTLPNDYSNYKVFLIENGLGDCVDLAQDTPYHTLSVSRHMYYAYEKSMETMDKDIQIAMMLHDIGKPYCKEFNGRYASFFGHENVSAQMAIETLKGYNLSDRNIIKIATLIQLHMMMHNKEWGSKSQEKFKKEIGEDMWSDLVLLNSCDTLAK